MTKAEDNVNAKDDLGKTALMRAADTGNLETVNELIAAEGIDVNAKDNLGKTALMRAAENGHTGIVQALIDAGADVKAKDKNYMTATLEQDSDENHEDVEEITFGEGNNYTETPESIKTLTNQEGIQKLTESRQRGANDMTALMYAAAYNNEEEVKKLIDGGANVDDKDKEGMTALMYAVLYGNEETVQALIEAGADVKAIDIHGLNAIKYAAEKGHTKIVQALIAAGADVNIKDKDGKTALMYAAEKGHTEIVQALIGAGADVKAVDKDGKTALVHAAENDHTKIVQALIEAGADVNAKDKDVITALLGRTAGEIVAKVGSFNQLLIEAVKQGKQVQEAQRLIGVGADVNAVDTFYMTALMYAAVKGHTEIVRALIGAGADVKAVDKDGSTALMLAAAGVSNLEMLKALIAAGADVEAVDKDGMTALMYAAKYGNEETVRELIEKSADVEAVDKDCSTTALMHAAEYGNKETVQALIGVGANVNAVDKDGKTALMYAAIGKPETHAAENGHTETVQALIGAGADVNAKDKEGMTALMYAAAYGNEETVQALIEAGADVNIKDNNEFTALSYAQNNKDNVIIVGLLRSASKGEVSDVGPDHIADTASVSKVHEHGIEVTVLESDNKASKIESSEPEQKEYDFLKMLQEYHLYIIKMEKDAGTDLSIPDSDQDKKDFYQKILNQIGEHHGKKGYTKIPEYQDPDERKDQDQKYGAYGLKSEELSKSKIKTFLLKDDVKLSMAIDEKNKVYLSEESVKKIKEKKLTLSIKIPLDNGSCEYIEFIDGVLHITADSDPNKSRIAGKKNLHEWAGYSGENNLDKDQTIANTKGLVQDNLDHADAKGSIPGAATKQPEGSISSTKSTDSISSKGSDSFVESQEQIKARSIFQKSLSQTDDNILNQLLEEQEYIIKIGKGIQNQIKQKNDTLSEQQKELKKKKKSIYRRIFHAPTIKELKNKIEKLEKDEKELIKSRQKIDEELEKSSRDASYKSIELDFYKYINKHYRDKDYSDKANEAKDFVAKFEKLEEHEKIELIDKAKKAVGTNHFLGGGDSLYQNMIKIMKEQKTDKLRGDNYKLPGNHQAVLEELRSVVQLDPKTQDVHLKPSNVVAKKNQSDKGTNSHTRSK